jgi:hypothetical protein
MQDWQIKILELEVAGLKHLDDIIADHPLDIFIGLVYLLIAFGIGLIVVFCRGQRRRLRGDKPRIQPVVFIHLPGPPSPPPDSFEPFPPPHHHRPCDCNDEHWD